MVDAVHYSSDRSDWLTPDEILEAVVKAMGGIDLDPCSNSHEEPNVPALKHYTKEDDGLAQPWYGRVFANPPYSKKRTEGIHPWSEKLIEEWESGRLLMGIFLVPARPGSEWWANLSRYASCVVLIDGRLRFKGAPGAAPFPSALFAYGIGRAHMRRTFGQMGTVWVKN